MRSRTAFALGLAGLATAGLGGSVLPADAEVRTFELTLRDGKIVTVSLDVKPGTDVWDIKFPGVTIDQIQSIAELPNPAPVSTSPQSSSTTPTTTTAPPAGQTTATAPAAPVQPAEPQLGEPQVGEDGGGKQETTGKQRRKKDVAEEDVARQAPTSGSGGQRTQRRGEGGLPALGNPTTSLAIPGAAPIGVPNFFIDKFRIPPFLLPIYQAAGMEYGIRWEVLAAINEIETDYGRNLNVSSAGALGWMQFMPATWKQYGTDANGDKKKDPYNPVDAIFSAARYLKAAGAEKDLRKAIFAYNRADWYVDSVLMRARLIGGIPTDLVGSLTGLTQGRFPVAAKARYADDLDERKAAKRMRVGQNAAVAVESDATRRGILVFAKAGSPAVATHDSTVVKRGRTERLGRYVRVRDAQGNTYTYGQLASLESRYPVAKRGAKPARVAPKAVADRTVQPKVGTAGAKQRLFADPARPKARAAGGASQIDRAGGVAVQGRDDYVKDLLDLKPGQVTWKQLKPGARVVAGTVLGRIGRTSTTYAPHVLFEIRPAGRGAPRIDPKPILDGWKLLEATAIYRAKNKNPFFGDDAAAPTVGQILLMSKDALAKRVLSNPRIEFQGDGRLDIRSGMVDRRVLATLEFLAANGLKPTVSSLYRPGAITVSGNVSAHSSGNAVDIAAINGTPIIGNQGNGSITDITIRRLLGLQGVMKPDQIISLMKYPNADNTLAMGDHADHIHVGFRPVAGDTRQGSFTNATLKPGQWFKVIDRLNEIENPVVRKTPSEAAIKVKSVKPNARARARAARSAGSSR